MQKLIGLFLIGFGLFYATRTQAGVVKRPVTLPEKLKPMATIYSTWKVPERTAQTVTGWQPPAKAAPYLEWLKHAGLIYKLPPGLLERVAYQESHFRNDIISGETISSAGAVGIMQIVPRWHPGVDPLNPEESIYYAAKYLSDLKTQFGSWKMALAAYNWGPGNLANKGFNSAPQETKNYVAQIGADIPLA